MPDASMRRGEGRGGNGGGNGATGWPKLKPVGPDPAGPSVVLNKSVCVVGARSRVHLPLESPLVSKAHALIVNGGPHGVYVRDLASRNHVYVNGSRVREADLWPADLLRIGPFTFSCYSGFDRGDYEGRPERPPQAAATDWRGNGGPPPQAPAVELHLEGRGVRVPLRGRSFVIGARPECDLPLNGPGVSPVHAVIFQRGAEWRVRDLNSDDGTYLNGRRVVESPLQLDDVIRVGVVELRCAAAAVAATDAAVDGEAVQGHGHGSVVDAESLAAREEVSDPAYGFGVPLAGSETTAPVALPLPVSESAPELVTELVPAPEPAAEAAGTDGSQDTARGTETATDGPEPVPVLTGDWWPGGATGADADADADVGAPTGLSLAELAGMDLVPVAHGDAESHSQGPQGNGMAMATEGGLSVDPDSPESVLRTFDIPTFDIDWPELDPTDVAAAPARSAGHRPPGFGPTDSQPPGTLERAGPADVGDDTRDPDRHAGIGSAGKTGVPAESAEVRVLERRLTRVVRALSRNVARLGSTWRDLRARRGQSAESHGSGLRGRRGGTADKRSPDA